MKIVIATPLYPPEIGGPATYAKLLVEGLPQKGIEVAVVKFGEVRYLPKIIRHYVYYRRVLKIARTADMVLALDPVSVGVPAMQAAKKAKKPFVVKIVGDYAWEQGRQRYGVTQNLDEFVRSQQPSFFVRVLQNIQRKTATTAVKIIVPSHYLKNILVHGWNVAEEKITVIYNAISIETIGAVPDILKDIKIPFVVSVGRLVPWKHNDAIIDALEQVSELALVVVGDGPEREALQRRGKEKLNTRFVFLGQLAHEDTLAVMQRATALVLNSSYEGLSHVLIESQMLGVPAIATNVGGNPEVLHNPHTNLIENGNTSMLKNVLNDYIHRDRSLLSAEAFENAKRFSKDTMLETTAVLLKKLV